MARKAQAGDQPERVVKFIIPIPAKLHRRIKLSALSRDTTMTDAIIAVLERASWPVKDAV